MGFAEATASAITSTLAPNCGVPAASRTSPERTPWTDFNCATAGFAPKDENAAARTSAPMTRTCPRFTSYYLPEPVLAAALVGSGGPFTVKSAVLERVCFETSYVTTP